MATSTNGFKAQLSLETGGPFSEGSCLGKIMIPSSNLVSRWKMARGNRCFTFERIWKLVIFHSYVNIPEANSATFAVKRKNAPRFDELRVISLWLLCLNKEKNNRNPSANWEPFRWCIFQLDIILIISHYGENWKVYIIYIYILVGGVEHFLFVHNIWDNPSHWLICFKTVETTNQL